MTEEKAQDNMMQLTSHIGDERERIKEKDLEETAKQLAAKKDKFEAMVAVEEKQLQKERKSTKELECWLAERQQHAFDIEGHGAVMEGLMAKTEHDLKDLEDLENREEKRATHDMKISSLVPDRIIYEWKIEHVKNKLSRSTSIQSPPFPPGATERRWQLSLVTERAELDALLLPHLTVIDSPYPVMKVSVNLLVLRGNGWTSVGSDDKQIKIDVNESQTGTAVIEDSSMTLEQLHSFTSKHDDSITIRCEITVCDCGQPDGAIPHQEATKPSSSCPALEDPSNLCDTGTNANRCHPKVVCSVQ